MTQDQDKYLINIQSLWFHCVCFWGTEMRMHSMWCSYFPSPVSSPAFISVSSRLLYSLQLDFSWTWSLCPESWNKDENCLYLFFIYYLQGLVLVGKCCRVGAGDQTGDGGGRTSWGTGRRIRKDAASWGGVHDFLQGEQTFHTLYSHTL